MVKTHCLEMDKNNVESLGNAKPPKNKIQLISLLGLWNVYWWFIDDFIGIAHPLNKIIKKGTPDDFELDEEQKQAFNNVIDKVCWPPVFSIYQKPTCLTNLTVTQVITKLLAHCWKPIRMGDENRSSSGPDIWNALRTYGHSNCWDGTSCLKDSSFTSTTPHFIGC